MFPACFPHFTGPDAGLDLSDVGAVQQKHAPVSYTHLTLPTT